MRGGQGRRLLYSCGRARPTHYPQVRGGEAEEEFWHCHQAWWLGQGQFLFWWLPQGRSVGKEGVALFFGVRQRHCPSVGGGGRNGLAAVVTAKPGVRSGLGCLQVRGAQGGGRVLVDAREGCTAFPIILDKERSELSVRKGCTTPPTLDVSHPLNCSRPLHAANAVRYLLLESELLPHIKVQCFGITPLYGSCAQVLWVQRNL